MSQSQESKQDIIFLLDESGSMRDMGNEPVEAINSFIKEQQSILVNDGSTFSLWKFSNVVTKVIDDKLLATVDMFENYKPNNTTALLDAIGEAIVTKKQKENYNNVICVILTDGYENSSKKYNKQEIKEMICNMKKNHNWKFIYLAANQDAFTIGNGYGMNSCANFSCDKNGLAYITKSTSDAIKMYRANSATFGNKAELQFYPGNNMIKHVSCPKSLNSSIKEVRLRRQKANHFTTKDSNVTLV